MPRLYKRKDSPYWWCWGHGPDGQRWTASTRQSSRREAEKAARAIERERLSEESSGYPAVPLLDALEALRKHKVRMGASVATLDILRQKRERLESHFGFDRDVLGITLADAEAYVDARRKDLVPRRNAAGAREDRPTSDHTISKELGVLRQALRLLRKHDLYPGDPASIWPEALRAVYTPRDRWLTVDEYRVLLEHVGVHRRRYVQLYTQTGLRLSELHQCERDGDSLRVRQTKGTGSGESERVRVVPLSPEAVEVLDETPLPWRPWGKIQRDLASACRRARIDRTSPNDLRRTFASWLCQAGVPELTVVRLMGHGDSTMIRRVYAQLAPETLAAAVALLPTSRVSDDA